MMWSLLVGLFVGLVAGGGSGNYKIFEETLEKWEGAIKKHVDDDSREEKALSLIEKARADSLAYNKSVTEAFVKYYEIDNDYNATMEDYRKSLANVNVQWDRVDEWMLDIRFEMKDILTEEEWLLAMGRVQKKSAKMDKKMTKRLKKADKKLDKKIKKYDKKYGGKYQRPESVQLEEIAPELEEVEQDTSPEGAGDPVKTETPEEQDTPDKVKSTDPSMTSDITTDKPKPKPIE